MINLKRLALLAACAWVPGVFAQSNAAPEANSVEWQRITLEQSIEKKVKEALSPLVPTNDSVVTVELTVRPPEPVTPPLKKTGNEPKKIELFDDLTRKPPEDYVVFQKLGLTAPYVDPNAPKVDKDTPEKAAEAALEKPDIFHYLDAVKIEVSLDKHLTPTAREAVAQIVAGLKFNFKDVKPSINVKYIDLARDLPQVEPKPFGFSDLLGKLKDSIGMLSAVVLGALLLGLVAFLLFGKYENLMRRLGNDAAAPDMEVSNETQLESSPDGAPVAGEPIAAPPTNESITGAERFKRFLAQSPKEASLLVKKWIQNQAPETRRALVALVHQLSSEELLTVFSFLSIDERTQWKDFISNVLSDEETPLANKFIADQVIGDIIVPNLIEDAETLDVLTSLTPEQCAKFCAKHPTLGRVIMNVMTAPFISDMLAYLDAEAAATLVHESLRFEVSEIKFVQNELKAKLEPYRRVVRQSPFAKKIMELIPVAKAALEGTLYRTLAETGDLGTVRRLAMEFLPSELISKLSAGTLRAIFKNYSTAQKVRLLASLDEFQKKSWLNIIAPEESRLREMLDLELEKIRDDASLGQEIAEGKDKLWQDFVDFCRQSFRTDSRYHEELERLVQNWSESLNPNDAAAKTGEEALKAA